MPAPRALTDGFGRIHRDLRISVTDRCDLRCTYCMPAEGLPWLPRDQILSFEEIERVARIMVERFGFTSIRLTGGEPTVRHDLVSLVERLARLPVDLSMTTNGRSLRLHADRLAAAGLGRVNVSLDTLRSDRFEALTRRTGVEAVIDGIDAAVTAGLGPVKVNCVVMRGVNEDELVDLARFGRDRGVTLRFIEFMPLDADGAWRRSDVVTRTEIVAAITSVFPAVPVARGHAPAERFRYSDGAGEFGVIPTVTAPFCGDCDRVRLTAEGALRNCLFATSETDLRELLRAGATDDLIAERIEACVQAKWAGHGVGTVTFVQPSRSMSRIGG